jgi:ribosome maturation factor RimP
VRDTGARPAMPGRAGPNERFVRIWDPHEPENGLSGTIVRFGSLGGGPPVVGDVGIVPTFFIAATGIWLPFDGAAFGPRERRRWSMAAERFEALEATFVPVLAALDLDLYDVEMTGSGKARTLRVTVDRAAGVDLEAITAATNAISPVLDQLVEAGDPAARAHGGPYTLEVSSPGLERALRTPSHFRRAIGTTVSVKTRGSETAGPQRRRGVVADADDAGFEIDIDGTRERLAYDDVVQARTVFEWGAEQKVAP